MTIQHYLEALLVIAATCSVGILVAITFVIFCFFFKVFHEMD